jgi:hypothetical protein
VVQVLKIVLCRKRALYAGSIEEVMPYVLKALEVLLYTLDVVKGVRRVLEVLETVLHPSVYVRACRW